MVQKVMTDIDKGWPKESASEPQKFKIKKQSRNEGKAIEQ